MQSYLKFKNESKFDTLLKHGLTTIEINPTELCNRICSFCPRGNGYLNQHKHLSIENSILLKKRLSEFNYKGVLTISGKGEPLLNPNIVSIVKNLSSFNPTLITNGDLLTYKLIDKLFINGLSKLVISNYSGKQWNISKKYSHFIKEFGTNYESDFNNRCGYINDNIVNNICYVPFYKMSIDYDLSIDFCANDWHYKEKVGSLLENTLEYIWLGPVYNEYRQKLINSRNNVNSCKKCDVKGTLLGEKSFSLFNSINS